MSPACAHSITPVLREARRRRERGCSGGTWRRPNSVGIGLGAEWDSAPDSSRGPRSKILSHATLAEKKVKNYVSHLLAKLGMARRSEAAAYAGSSGGASPGGLRIAFARRTVVGRRSGLWTLLPR